MKKLFTFLFALVFAMSLGVMAYAKEDMSNSKDMSNSSGSKEMSNAKESGKFVTRAEGWTFKANDIIGAKVENRDGKSLGTIKELGIDPKTDRVAFAVIAHGGAVGVGEKQIAVPLKALSLRTDENGKIKMFVLNMNEDRFANAPSFDTNSWPNKQSAERSYKYFGQSPYWSGQHKTTSHTSSSSKTERTY